MVEEQDSSTWRSTLADPNIKNSSNTQNPEWTDSTAQNPGWKDFTVIIPELVRVISGEISCQEDSCFKKIYQEGSGIKKIGMLVDPSTEMTEMLVGSGTKMTEMLLDSGIKKTAILKLLYYIIKSPDMGVPDSVMYSSVEIFFQKGSSIQIILVVAGSKVFIHKGRILQRSTTDFTVIKMSTKTLKGEPVFREFWRSDENFC
jgi:hypothetical protein